MVREAFLSRAALHLENLALQQQLAALDRKGARPSLRMADRLFWVVLSRLWSFGCREILVISQAGDGYRLASKVLPDISGPGSRDGGSRDDRPCRANSEGLSGAGCLGRIRCGAAPRIHGELRMLGFEVSEAAVFKYMPRHPKPPSQTWRTFLENHVGCRVDRLLRRTHRDVHGLLFLLVVLRHERRRIVHIGTTAHPTAAWVAHQIREAFPWETAPRYMLRQTGSCVRYCLSFADKGDGHRRGRDGAAIAVAVAVR